MFGFRRKAPQPQTVADQQMITPGAERFNPYWQFTYVKTRQPDPGNSAYAYETLGLSEFTPIGAGVANRAQLKVVQPPPGYAIFTASQAGLGGLVMGTIYGQPLITNGGGIEGQFT